MSTAKRVDEEQYQQVLQQAALDEYQKALILESLEKDRNRCGKWPATPGCRSIRSRFV